MRPAGPPTPDQRTTADLLLSGMPGCRPSPPRQRGDRGRGRPWTHHHTRPPRRARLARASPPRPTGRHRRRRPRPTLRRRPRRPNRRAPTTQIYTEGRRHRLEPPRSPVGNSVNDPLGNYANVDTARLPRDPAVLVRPGRSRRPPWTVATNTISMEPSQKVDPLLGSGQRSGHAGTRVIRLSTMRQPMIQSGRRPLPRRHGRAGIASATFAGAPAVTARRPPRNDAMSRRIMTRPNDLEDGQDVATERHLRVANTGQVAIASTRRSARLQPSAEPALCATRA